MPALQAVGSAGPLIWKKLKNKSRKLHLKDLRPYLRTLRAILTHFNFTPRLK